MKYIQTTLFLVGISLALSCQKKACQNPPPSYKIAFTDSKGQSFVNDSLQATALQLSYLSTSGIPTKVSPADFMVVVSNDRYKFIYNLGYGLFAQSEQNQYLVQLNSKVMGKLILTSQRDNSVCDGWMHLTEVRFNDQLVSRSADNVTYVIALNP